MKATASIQHVAVSTETPFDLFRSNFEKHLGRFDFASYQKLVNESPSAETLQNYFAANGNSDRLLFFSTYDHGSLVSALSHQPQKAVTYIVGNPMIAAQMTKHDLRAALYAPLRVLVYADDAGQAHIEYDLPSSLFGQFGNSDVTKVALALDEKLAKVIEDARN